MTTVQSEAKSPAEAGATPANATISAGWLLRRAALWILCVMLGIAGSCLLYMAGSQAEADSVSRPASAEPQPPATAKL